MPGTALHVRQGCYNEPSRRAYDAIHNMWFNKLMVIIVKRWQVGLGITPVVVWEEMASCPVC